MPWSLRQIVGLEIKETHKDTTTAFREVNSDRVKVAVILQRICDDSGNGDCGCERVQQNSVGVEKANQRVAPLTQDLI